jgi:hypothetical protein
MDDKELFENKPVISRKGVGGNPAWVKGKSGNPYGRPKGSLNARTKDIRGFFTLIMEKNLPRLQKDLNGMTGFQRWQILNQLSNKFLPNLSATQIDAAVSGDLNISVSFEEMGTKVQNNDDIEDADVVE